MCSWLLYSVWLLLGGGSLMEVPFCTVPLITQPDFREKTFLSSERTPLDYRIDIITAVEVYSPLQSFILLY